MYLYHFTKKSNLLSIMKVGLFVKSKEKGLTLHRKNRNCIYLTSDKDYIRKVAIAPNDYARLRIDCSELDIQNELDFSRIYQSKKYYPKHTCFIVYSNIPVSKIQAG